MKDIVRFNILGRPVSSKSMRRSFHERSREAEKEFFKDTVKITKDQTYELAQERAEGIEVTEESLRSNTTQRHFDKLQVLITKQYTG